MSRSWLYAQPDIPAEIQRLRDATRLAPTPPIPAAQRATAESLRQRLLTTQRIRQLTEENLGCADSSLKHWGNDATHPPPGAAPEPKPDGPKTSLALAEVGEHGADPSPSASSPTSRPAGASTTTSGLERSHPSPIGHNLGGMSRRFGLVGALLVAASAVAALLAVIAGPAAAITNGGPDGNGHPGVGALIADTAFPDGTWAYCSGTLIAPTVVLTAAHCGDPGQTAARVGFSSQYHDRDRLYVGRFIPDPRYREAQSDSFDIAVVVFDEPVRGISPAQLPTVGLLDQMKADGSLKTATFTAVGYGSLLPINGPGGKAYTYTDSRNVATTGSANSLTSSWLRLSQNASTGNGGTCDGDSGGPIFLRGASSSQLVATTITGDTACRSTNVDYRLDADGARSFLGRYVPLP